VKIVLWLSRNLMIIVYSRCWHSKYRNFEFITLISNHFCTLYIIFLRFSSVNLDFKTWEVVRPASIILPCIVQQRSPSSLFALIFLNGMPYHYVKVHINSGTNVSVGEYWFNSFWVKWGRMQKLYRSSAAIWRSLFIRHTDVPKRIAINIR